MDNIDEYIFDEDGNPVMSSSFDPVNAMFSQEDDAKDIFHIKGDGYDVNLSLKNGILSWTNVNPTDIFAVPEELCVYHYAKATIDYSRRNSPNALEEIHFIDINPSIVNRIQNMFTTLLRNREDPHYSTERFVKTRNQNYSRDFPPPSKVDRRNRNSPTGEPIRNRRSPGKESDMNRHSLGGKPDMEPNRNIHSPGKESDRNIHSPDKASDREPDMDREFSPNVPGRNTDTVSKMKRTPLEGLMKLVSR